MPWIVIKLLQMAPLMYNSIGRLQPWWPQACFTAWLHHMKTQIPAWAHHIPAWQQPSGLSDGGSLMWRTGPPKLVNVPPLPKCVRV